jgi:signal transduction histidine kinase
MAASHELSVNTAPEYVIEYLCRELVAKKVVAPGNDAGGLLVQAAPRPRTTRLPAFIRDHTEQILVEWETFARSVETETPLDTAALRDHAKEMLGVVAADLDMPQTPREQADKAQGKSDAHPEGRPTAAQQHGAGRAVSGFTVEQMVSEFRALRASVLRLWMRECGEADAEDLEDLTRFNESVDQAIAESIMTYTRGVRQSRDRFLAVLGHDLRTPIGAIMTSTEFLRDLGDLQEPHRGLIDQMHKSARRMNRLVGDLLELTRTRMGDSIPITRAKTDVGQLLDDVVHEMCASYPTHRVEIQKTGNLRGMWDCERLMQALINLLSNAVHHGAPEGPIMINARGADREVTLSVHNEGPPIEAARMDHLFDAMKEIQPAGMRDRRHLGLGLYIVDKIVDAHDGRIEVQSSRDDGTTFTIHLPRGT